MNGFNTPQETAQEMVKIGKNKVSLSLLQMIVLGILAGAYIGFGAELSNMVTHDLASKLGVGFSKFLGGSVFSIGLMLVVIGGSELFTGNCLIPISIFQKEARWGGMLKNWFWVYLANFLGSLILVWIILYSGLWKINGHQVGIGAISTALTKVNLSWSEAFFRGIGCNWLVCLAVWLAVAGKDAVSKIFGIYFPIMAFVASGFEHSIANMYFIPIGIYLKGTETALKSGLNLTSLTWSNFFIKNLIPVTIGNIVGGAIFVAGFYYLAYLKGQKR